MNGYKYINRVFKVITRCKNACADKYDFSSFAPLTSKQLLLERCKKQGVPIYVDNPLEQSSGVYSIFRNTASEAELERRFNAQKMIIFSESTSVSAKRAYFIALLALIVSAIPYIGSAIPLIRPFL